MARLSARQRFLDYVRGVPGAAPVVSPFLPHAPLVERSLRLLGLPTRGDAVEQEIALARALGYEPMFMTDCPGLIFPWQDDPTSSSEEWVVSRLDTAVGPWERCVSRRAGLFGDDAGFPVRTEADHEKLVAACARVADRDAQIRQYFRGFRQRVGDGGVIVIGHPHVTWLGYQISQPNMIFHAADFPQAYARSMEAVFQAALVVFGIAMEEGIDFMSESGYGLEMISPEQFAAQDLPYTRRLADWTHARGGLFWYHNCGRTRTLFRSRAFDQLGADVLETVAPPPEGDNDLAESRRWLDPAVCSKGNLSLMLLRDGSAAQVEEATRRMVRATRGSRHVHSTADAVFAQTPPENFVAFVRTARQEAERCG
ncbi:MAG: uroporphyrinogen decarboxylase family protein [Candidatus Latescibacterota bacterium]